MGRSAWYLPTWARRVLPNVTFGHSPEPSAIDGAVRTVRLS